ncbi:SCE4755 family polysaccharide monooxygenase-like protein [Bdellovibrio sp. HCB337]|uniref:SCE4755 family polysaccharide monooxygenase-like protein n=1 Tax=Bdellovibrio sp. HCB337 TaxID=3394358 RepID=UPI0039A50E62
MKSLFHITILWSGILLSVSFAQAHSRLKASDVIKIRSTDPGVKIGPCGGFVRVAQPAVINGGQSITVTWEETIYHPGRFEFYFSTGGDQNFTLLKTIQNNQQGMPLPHQFSTTLNIPDVNCSACTFQMIQVMTENPANPTNYYSCADMQVKGSATAPSPTPTPAATATPSTTPTPSTGDDCH